MEPGRFGGRHTRLPLRELEPAAASTGVAIRKRIVATTTRRTECLSIPAPGIDHVRGWDPILNTCKII